MTTPPPHLLLKPTKATTPYHQLQTLVTTKANIPQLHAHLITTNSPHLINLYLHLGLPSQALLDFHHHSPPPAHIITWTSLIYHLSKAHLPLNALSLFSLLHRRATPPPNAFTLSAVLPACAATRLPAHGRQVHALACKHGALADVFVASALADMYAKCDDMASSEKVFDEMPVKNLVSWNSMVVGFVRNGMHGKAIETFRELVAEGGAAPDQVSFSSVLSACTSSGELAFGRGVHAYTVKVGADGLAYVKNSLMDMYLKCRRRLEEARMLFESMEEEERDVVSWNIMMMGWVQAEQFEEACSCFSAMCRAGIQADVASFCTVLQALWSIASWSHGATVHAQIVKTGTATDRNIGSPLIRMYAKCGSLEDANRAFEETRDQLNLVSWTDMIAAFQQHGHGDRAIKLFDRMLKEGIEPDYITFVCVLSACSHKGLVDQGFGYFGSMSERYGIVPGNEHYACMVDMLGRAGRLEEAKRFIDTMPIEPDASVWGALLAACRNCSNLELGKEVAQRLFEIEPENSGNYVLLSNMYACHGKLEEAREVRRLMGCRGVRKETGCSWIDVKDRTYVFVVHDRSHSRTREIYEMLRKLEDLVKEKGYVADTRFAGYKGLWYHSERLALAFGMISLPAGVPILIKKNLRTCVDCHAVMKLISGILQREIVMRDINRFHRFADGSCSCGDYW